MCNSNIDYAGKDYAKGQAEVGSIFAILMPPSLCRQVQKILCARPAEDLADIGLKDLFPGPQKVFRRL